MGYLFENGLFQLHWLKRCVPVLISMFFCQELEVCMLFHVTTAQRNLKKKLDHHGTGHQGVQTRKNVCRRSISRVDVKWRTARRPWHLALYSPSQPNPTNNYSGFAMRQMLPWGKCRQEEEEESWKDLKKESFGNVSGDFSLLCSMLVKCQLVWGV